MGRLAAGRGTGGFDVTKPVVQDLVCEVEREVCTDVHHFAIAEKKRVCRIVERGTIWTHLSFARTMVPSLSLRAS